MKILALRGENLASLQSEFEIDFAEGRLGDAGLFAITGKTGAGKSTLLDAICLALYDRMPRLQSNKKNDAEIGRDSDDNRIKANDVRSILSRGKAQGFAEVDFIANDGSHWRAHWQVRRARGRAEGKIQAAEQWLENLETGQRFAGKKQELQCEIERLVGLSFEQFRRAVMLPQGEFAAFLKAGADERAALLERMTGGEIYGRLSIAAYERARDEKKNLEQLQDKLGDIALLSDEEKESINNQLNSERKQAEQQQQAIDLLKQHQQVMVTEQQLVARITESQQQLVQAEEVKLQAKPRYQVLEQYEQALPARGDFVLLTKALESQKKWQQTQVDAEKELEQKNNQLQQLSLKVASSHQALIDEQQQWDALEPKLKQAAKIEQQRSGLQVQHKDLHTQTEQLSQKLAKQRQQLAEKQQHQQQYQSQLQQTTAELAASQTSKVLAEQQRAVQDNIIQYLNAEQQRQRLSGEVKQLEQQQSLQQQQQGELDKKLVALQQQKQQLNDHSKDHDLDVLEQQQEQYRQHYSDYQHISHKLKEALYGLDKWQDLLHQQLKLEQQKKDFIADIEKSQQRLVVLEPELAQLTALRKEVDSQLTQSRAVMSLTDYRHELIEDEPCPLCGAVEHPYQQHNPHVEAIISQQQQRLQQLEQALREGESERRQLSTSVDQDQKRSVEIEKELVTISQSIAHLVNNQQPLWSALMATELSEITLAEITLSPSCELDDLSRFKNDWLQATQSAEAMLVKIKQQGEQQKKLIEQQRKYHQQLKQLVHDESVFKEQGYQLSQKLTQAQERLNSLKDQQATQQQLATQRQNTLSDIYGDDAWLSALQQQGQASFIEQLEQQIQQYQQNLHTQQQLTVKLADLVPVMTNIISDVSHSEQQLKVMTEKLDALTKQQQECWKQRVELIGEAALEKIESHHKNLIQRQQQEWKQLDTEQNQLAKTLASIETQAQHAKQLLEESTEQVSEHQAVWQQWLTRLSLDEAQLTTLLSKDETWLQQERLALKEIEQAVSAKQTIVDERQQAKRDHQATLMISQQWFTDHEINQDLESQQQIMQQWQDQKAQFDDQIFQLRQRIAQGEQAEKQAGDLRSALEKQQAKTELWMQMNELIGSATGNKFRTLAQGLTLQQLVITGNQHLKDLAPRYALQPVPGSPLALQVIDHDMGDEVRSVESLSGGECFLVSLSLALALASLAADTRQLGSLFIDEGFGTLDPDSLEMALACLDALQADGRQIGVISHVGTLVERIGVQVAVEAIGGGRSKIVIKG